MSLGIVDCDVHPYARSREHLKRYLPRGMHRRLDQVAGRELFTAVPVGARPNRSFHREDAFPAAGGTPGSDLELLREQLLDRFGISRAVLVPLDNIGVQPFGELGLTLAAAVNDWLAAEWLDADDRFVGSIAIPIADGERAAREIERVAQDPRFVQVVILAPTPDPLGDPRYWTIYEAADAFGLPVALHPGGFSGAVTGTGYPTYFFEFHVGLPFAYSSQVVSLLHSGVFTRFPELQVVLQEGGISWMVPLMARLDRAYAGMRDELPHLQEPPSATIRRHFWFTTQPIEEPHRPEHLVEMLERLGMEDRILFSSDYPHWDFDAPDRALGPAIPRELRERIMRVNARSLYRFPERAALR
jgi:predicted TIM-barrel fold metal-dependent hydrolase